MISSCAHTFPLAFRLGDEREGSFSRSTRSLWSKTQNMSAKTVGLNDASIDIDALYRQYAPMVFRRCRSMLKNEQRAQDAMQDTFIKVIRYQDRLHDTAPSSLLYRIATNVCLNIIRSTKRKPEDSEDDIVSKIASYEDVAEKGNARSLLSKLFGQEKESTRVIAMLHFADGMTLQEVADEVGMSMSGVRKRLRRLRERLHLLDDDSQNLASSSNAQDDKGSAA